MTLLRAVRRIPGPRLVLSLGLVIVADATAVDARIVTEGCAAVEIDTGSPGKFRSPTIRHCATICCASLLSLMLLVLRGGCQQVHRSPKSGQDLDVLKKGLQAAKTERGIAEFARFSIELRRDFPAPKVLSFHEILPQPQGALLVLPLRQTGRYGRWGRLSKVNDVGQSRHDVSARSVEKPKYEGAVTSTIIDERIPLTDACPWPSACVEKS